MTNNRLDNLAIELVNIIKTNKEPFNNYLVLFPNTKLIQWFKTYYLKNYKDVLMGVELTSINKGIFKIFKIKKEITSASNNEIRGLIIKYLLDHENKDKLPKFIQDYINPSSNDFSYKLNDLANELTNLFILYDSEETEIKDNQHLWQKDIIDFLNNELLKEDKGLLGYVYKTQFERFDSFKLILFGFSCLEGIHKHIIDDYKLEHNVVELLLEPKDTFDFDVKFTKAPSRLREIENVHSEICNLLKNKELNYTDFLVVSPNIVDYENEINRVFNQTDSRFPSIPFSIIDNVKVESDITLGLKILFDIYIKGFFTRLDLYNLLNINSIGKIRGISNDDLKAIIDALDKTNTFRYDWDYFITRLALSKVSNINNGVIESKIDVGGHYEVPFESFALTDELICKTIEIVKDLLSFKNNICGLTELNITNCQLLKNELDKWFSVKDSSGNETSTHYLKVLNAIDIYKDFDIFNSKLPFSSVFLNLIDSSMKKRVKKGEMFTHGITFTGYNKNSILSAKYVFFIGCQSNLFPIKYTRSIIDARGEEDINKSTKEENDSFLLQYQNALATFYVSFVYKNLGTDEDYYLSSCARELILSKYKDAINKVDEKERESYIDHEYIELLKIDETRLYKDIFTRRGFKEKERNINLYKNVDTFIDSVSPLTHIYCEKVSLNNMRDFLVEPLLFITSQTFGREDNLKEQINKEYEELELDNLKYSIAFKTMVLNRINGRLNAANDIDQDEGTRDKLSLTHFLPSSSKELEEASYYRLEEEVDNLFKYIENQNYFEKDHFKAVKLKDLRLSYNPHIDLDYLDEEDKIITYTLTCPTEVFVYFKDNERIYIDLRKNSNDLFKIDRHSLYLYVYALMDIASLEDDGIKNVTLITSLKGKKIINGINKSTAILLLNKIYHNMGKFSNYVYFPHSEIGKLEQPLNQNIEYIIDSFAKSMLWKNAKNVNVLDKRIHHQYKEDTASQTIKNMCELFRDLVWFNKGDK